MSADVLCKQWAGISTPVIGMIHLPPLPGSPGYTGGLSELRQHVLADARALEAGGVHGLMIENFGDVPFHADRVGPETVAAMTALAVAIRQATALPIGINVLRNDAAAALAVALASDAAFIRVNVLTGATVTDQGLIEGRAAEVMRYRRSIGADHVRVLADIQVKHAMPLVSRPIEEEVGELISRGLADGLIVSGWATGAPTDPSTVRLVKDAAGGTPVFVGSGATAQSVPGLAEVADGFIVGTHFKIDGRVHNAVDPARVEALVMELA